MVESTGEWYLIGLHGDMVLRVRQGMPLGETEAGELSFDPSCAQLELGIADDGGLLLSAVQDHELEFGGGARCRHERLARDRSPEIRLPHNVLRLVTDFVDPAQANETVEIRAVRPAENIEEPQIDRLPETPSGVPTELAVATRPRQDIALVANGSIVPRTERAGARGRRILSPSMVALIVVSGLGFALLYSALPAHRDDAAPKPSETVAAPTRIAPAQTPSTVAVSTDAGSETAASTVPPSPKPVPMLPPKQLLPAVNAPPATEPARREKVAERPAARSAAPAVRLAETEPVAAPLTPAVQPRVKSPSIPDVAKAAAADTAVTIRSQPQATVVAERKARSATTQTLAENVTPTPSAASEGLANGRLTASADAAVAIRSEPKATVVAEPDEPIATTPAPTVDATHTPLAADQALTQPRLITPSAGTDTAVTISSPPEATVVAEPDEHGERTRTPTEVPRTLFAADEALAQGRLTAPAEANAYTLYNRVLELDPESTQARSGLRSVRQALVNRALAQLASGALEDARMSLQAAADAGADPSLVAHLRDEVHYRQQLVNARGEQHE